MNHTQPGPSRSTLRPHPFCFYVSRWWKGVLGMAMVIATSSDLCAQLANPPTASPSSSIAFRVDTDFYSDQNAKPMMTVKTIFHAGRYIEINESNQRTTVFEPNLDRISVIDTARSVRTEIDTRMLNARVSEAQSKMQASQLAALTGQDDPAIDDNGFLVINNAFIRYRVKPQLPSNRDIVANYTDYADWSVRLNALYAKQPPQLRMQLNQLLSQSNQIPREIRRSILKASDKEGELVAVHLIQESLGEEDRNWIARVDGWMRTSSLVSEDVFFAPPSVAQKPSGAKK